MAAVQPGETPRKYARVVVVGAPFSKMRPFDRVLLRSGQPATAADSTPGRARRSAAT